MNVSEIYPRRISAKEVLTTQRGKHFIFPVADDTAKLSGTDHEFRESTTRQEQLARSEGLRKELDQSRLHKFGKNGLPGSFLRHVLIAGGVWKGVFVVANIE